MSYILSIYPSISFSLSCVGSWSGGGLHVFEPWEEAGVPGEKEMTVKGSHSCNQEKLASNQRCQMQIQQVSRCKEGPERRHI